MPSIKNMFKRKSPEDILTPEQVAAMKERERLKFAKRKLRSQYTKSLSRQYGYAKSPNYGSKFRGELSRIRQTVNAPQVRQRNIMQQNVNVSYRAPVKKRNFFETRSEYEVYGDDGLTLFDSEKRGGDDTGRFFGI